MIADTTFLSDLLRERQRDKEGPAAAMLRRLRDGRVRTTIISVAEIAVLFDHSFEAWNWLEHWKIYPLHQGIAQKAADIDRRLKNSGQRLGENDNWIAGFAAYYQEPVISHDVAFDRIPGVRRIAYERF